LLVVVASSAVVALPAPADVVVVWRAAEVVVVAGCVVGGSVSLDDVATSVVDVSHGVTVTTGHSSAGVAATDGAPDAGSAARPTTAATNATIAAASARAPARLVSIAIGRA
jgi:hypothetical protein